ncbi:MAG: hypothetical protein DI565_01165 [Ancylobacter novellus]|uniref:Uncharacterized protein n=1 Tax=Ancylobacter novellus TaxID=921 RepID=A0A2W5KWA7_ANCNO|nr:MAG: hypothetical protein DI565_01165 [Ancylobacter novellus]
MAYRVFPNRETKPEDETPRSFGRRSGFVEPAVHRLTAGRVVKALALGLGIGTLAALIAPGFWLVV